MMPMQMQEITTDQKDQDSSSSPSSSSYSSSISISESTTQGEISSYDYDYEYDPKFFDSFWTEPFFPSYNNNYNNNDDDNSCSRVLDLDLEDWMAENELINSFQTLSTESSDALIFEQVLSDPQSSSNDLISCADDVFGGFWNDPASFSSFDLLPPVMEAGIFNNISSSFEYYYDIYDLFNQF